MSLGLKRVGVSQPTDSIYEQKHHEMPIDFREEMATQLRLPVLEIPPLATMITAKADCQRADLAFGPVVAPTCHHGQDFTLFFEQSILTLAPASIFVVILTARIIHLAKKEQKCQRGALRIGKLVTSCALAAVCLSLVAVWSVQSLETRRTALVSSVVSFVVALQTVVLSWLEDARSVKPSTAITAYVLFTAILDIPQGRSLWLRHYDVNATLFSAAISLKAILLILENNSKRSRLLTKFQTLPYEATSGILDRSFLWWLNRTFRKGYSKALSLRDLHVLDKSLSSASLSDMAAIAWAKRHQPERRWELPLVLCKEMWTQLVWIVVPRLLLVGLTFAQPFLIKKILTVLSPSIDGEGKSVSSYMLQGIIMTAATILVFVGLAVLRLHYNQELNRFKTMFRGAAVSIIYGHALQTPDGVYDESAAVTLMSTDVDQIAGCLTQINELWARSMEVAVGIYLLARELGYLSSVPILLVFASFLGIRHITKRIPGRQKIWFSAIQKRVALTSSILANIRNVKMMGLGPLLTEVLQNQRIAEVRGMVKLRWSIVWQNVVQNLPWAFAPALTFVILASSGSRNAEPISVEKAFTSLSIITLLTDPAAKLLSAIPSIASSMGSISRVQDFLVQASKNAPQSDQEEHDDLEHGIVVQLENLWAKPPGSKASVLRGLTLSLPKGSITAIIGPVASGKTTLLKAMLKETVIDNGYVHVVDDSIAYCSQSAWLPNTSIKQAICHPFTQTAPVDELLYKEILRTCALDYDISLLVDGDETILGSGSTTLSGGQKQRVALARALYSRKSIILLDDVLSALDKPTQRYIIDALFKPTGLCKRQSTTVVIATHTTEVLQHVDKIIALCEGCIEHEGTYDQLLRLGTLQKTDYFQERESVSNNASEAASQAEEKSAAVAEANEREDIARHTRDLAIYKYYFRTVGWFKALTFLWFAFLHVFAVTFSHLWLKWWVDQGGDQAELFIPIFVLLAFLNASGIAGYSSSMLVQITPAIARKLHYVLLTTIMRAPPQFFARVDNGSILNRFSQDMSILETQLPTGVLVTITNIIGAAAEAALIATGSTFMAITIPFLVLVVYVLQDTYLRTSCQLRLLDLETRAPLFSHFLETLDGLATIRAFGWQRECQRLCEALLDDSQKPHYMLMTVQTWLSLVLDLIVAGEAVIVVCLAMFLRAHTDVSLLGVSLNNILSFNGSLSSVIGGWTILETSLGSIARLRALEMEVQPEDPDIHNGDVPKNWPSHGAIHIDGLTASHSPSSIAVRNADLSILPGQKIGICGRTGSGKSSLIATIARMTDIDAGSISIDGLDLTTLRKDQVRDILTFVPQDAPILNGTIRFNLDPEGRHEDVRIIETLRQVGLWNSFETDEGLSTELTALSLSHGQRQMVSLARAILKKSKILLLDEPTSNIDEATDTLLQKLLREEFADCTVITVAHRINTIYPGSDVIVVMHEGTLAEVGPPGELIGRGGMFSALASASGSSSD